MQGLFKKFNVFLRKKDVKKNNGVSQFEIIKADLEKQGITVASEEALISFLSDESTDVAELLNQNRLHHGSAKIVEMVEPLPSQSARMQPLLREHE